MKLSRAHYFCIRPELGSFFLDSIRKRHTDIVRSFGDGGCKPWWLNMMKVCDTHRSTGWESLQDHLPASPAVGGG